MHDGRDEPPETVDVYAFGRRFTGLLPGLAEDLVTIEKEGAIYSQFWDETSQDFRDYRIRLLPREIVQHVDAYVASEEFNAVARAGGSFDEALAAITDERVRELVRTYESSIIDDDGQRMSVDLRGCFASFLPRDVEAVVCGQTPHRYERLPDLGDTRSRLAIVRAVLRSFPVVVTHLGARGRGRPPIVVEVEYDVQDLLYAILRPIFPDIRYEDWTPKVAGRSRRIDLVIPELRVVIEVKIVRDARHARSVVAEILVDIETYHSHPHCGRLVAFYIRSWPPCLRREIDRGRGVRLAGETGPPVRCRSAGDLRVRRSRQGPYHEPGVEDVCVDLHQLAGVRPRTAPEAPPRRRA